MTSYDPFQQGGTSPYQGYPPPPPPLPPGGGYPLAPAKGMATASLVVGIVGVVTGLIPLLFFISLPCGVVALVLGLTAWSKGRTIGAKQGRAGAWLGAIAVVLGVVGLVIVAGAVEALDDELDGDGEAATGTTDPGSGPAAGGDGIETNSGNDENPPPADINDDVTCSTEQFVGPKASGTLTNHSSQLSGYMISVGFLDEAGTRVAEGTAFVNNVRAQQTATWEAVAFDDVPYETCEVVSVERLAQ